MAPQFDIYTALCLVGFSQAVLWSLLLLQKPRRHYLPNQLLVSVLLLLAFAIGHFILQRSNYIFQLPHFAGLERPLFFLYAPALYLYIRAFLEPKYQLKSTDLLHLLPFALAVIWYLPLFFKPVPEKLTYLQNTSGLDVLTEFPFALFVLLQEGIYLTLIFQLYFKHKRQADESKASRIRWVRNFIVIFMVVSCLYALQIIFLDGQDRLFLIPLALSLFIYEIGYLGLKDPAVFNAPTEPDAAKPKYAKSALSESQAATFADRLQKLMDNEELFLDSDLSLAALASRLSISTNHLSQVLNQNLGETFYDYVNRQRIAYASELLLAENGNYVVEEIAFKSGFNSKSAFNTAFRKHTGTTPSNFRKTHKDV